MDEGRVSPGRALDEAKNRIKLAEVSLDGFPGLIEELRGHMAAIETDYYQQVLKRSRDKNDTPDQREIAKQRLESLTATHKAYEKSLGRMITAITDGKVPPDAANFWLRGEIDRITKINNILRLKYNIKSSAVNLVQPLETLWPRVSTAEYAKLVAESLKPANRKRLEDLGVLDGATKLEGSTAAPLDRELAFLLSQDEELMALANDVESAFAVAEDAGFVFPEGESKGPVKVPKTLKEKIKDFSPFAAASSHNRMMGYLYGEMDAKKRGLTEPDQIHKNGLAWAEIVEFDNSTYNAPPLMRDTGMKLLLQYKGFTFKSIENLLDLYSAPGTKAEKAGRVAKWMAAKGITGGAKVLAGPLGAAGLITYVTARDMLKARGMSEEDAQKAAEAIYFGLPALVGADLSSSVSFLDEPFGKTTSEQAINFAAGPTLSSALNYGQMIRDGKSGLDIAQRVSPYVKQGVAITDIARGQSPDVRTVKNSKTPTGNRPPTLGEMALRTVAVPLSAQSAGYADKEVVDQLKEEAATLAERLADRSPTASGLTRDQVRKRRYKIEGLMKRIPDITTGRKLVESLRAKLNTPTPSGG